MDATEVLEERLKVSESPPAQGRRWARARRAERRVGSHGAGVARRCGRAHTLFGSPWIARRLLARAIAANPRAMASATPSTQNSGQ